MVAVAAVISVTVGVITVLNTGVISPRTGKNSNKFITIRLVEVKKEEGAWVPSTIHFKKGDIVELTIINGDDEYPYAFVRSEFGVETGEIPPKGQQTTITFKTDKVDTFRFIDPFAPSKCGSGALCTETGKIIITEDEG